MDKFKKYIIDNINSGEFESGTMFYYDNKVFSISIVPDSNNPENDCIEIFYFTIAKEYRHDTYYEERLEDIAKHHGLMLALDNVDSDDSCKLILENIEDGYVDEDTILYDATNDIYFYIDFKMDNKNNLQGFVCEGVDFDIGSLGKFILQRYYNWNNEDD